MIPDEILKIPLISRDLGLMYSEKHKPFTLQMTRAEEDTIERLLDKALQFQGSHERESERKEYLGKINLIKLTTT